MLAYRRTAWKRRDICPERGAKNLSAEDKHSTEQIIGERALRFPIKAAVNLMRCAAIGLKAVKGEER